MSSPDVIAQVFVDGANGTWRGWGVEAVSRQNTGGPGLYRVQLIERDFSLDMPVSLSLNGFGDIIGFYDVGLDGGREVLVVNTRDGAVSSIVNFSVTVWDNIDSGDGTITVVP